MCTFCSSGLRLNCDDNPPTVSLQGDGSEVPVTAVPYLTDEEVIDQLDSGSHWSGSTITYSFPTSTWTTYNGEMSGFSALGSEAQEAGHLAIGLWDDLMAPDFEFKTGVSGNSTDIEMAHTTSGPSYAWAYYPSLGSAFFNPNYDSGTNDVVTPEIGRHGFVTYIHELGHALGLNHMGDYNGGGSWSPESYQDSTVYSVMSYFGPSWGGSNSEGIAWADWVGSNGVRYSPQTPMLNDIMAIQEMYGVETTTRTGDTTYGYNSNVTGDARDIFDFDRNDHPILAIFDSAGNDTLDLSGWSGNSVIDIAPGAFSSGNAMTNNIAIAYTAEIENAVGGSGNDDINGNDLDNVLEGGAGNDDIDGKNGHDRLFGGANNDTLNGGEGDDFINGEGGVDQAFGGNGNDTIVYDDNDDWTNVQGGNGFDTLLFEGVWAALDLVANGFEQSALHIVDSGGADWVETYDYRDTSHRLTERVVTYDSGIWSVTTYDVDDQEDWSEQTVTHYTDGSTETTTVPDEATLTTPEDGDSSSNAVIEGAGAGTSVGITAEATGNGAVTYSLSDSAGGRFGIDAATGVVTVTAFGAANIDYESATSHQITVEASSGGETSSESFTVNVTNVAPTSPTDADGATNAIVEGAGEGTTVGITASAADPGGSDVTYALTNDAGGRFRIDATSGVVSLTAFGAANIDYESATSHQITVQANDGTASGDTTDFLIDVTNAAPDAPADSNASDNVVSESAEAGATVGVTAAASDVNGGTVTYALSDDAGGRFEIDATTGVVTTKTAIGYVAGGHTIEVVATDETLDESAASQFTVNVTRAPRFETTATAVTIGQNEAAAGVVIDGAMTTWNPDGSGFQFGRLTVSCENPNLEDTFFLQETGGITLDGDAVLFNGNTFGVWSGGSNGQPLTVEFGQWVYNDKVEALLRAVSYSSSADEAPASARNITIALTDTEGDTGTLSIALTVENDSVPPAFQDLATAVSVDQDAATTGFRIDADASLSNPDGTGFGTGSLTVSLDGATDDDTLAIQQIGGIALAAGGVFHNDIAFATWTGGTAGTDLAVSFDEGASDDAVNALLRAISLQTDAPPASARDLTLTVIDADGNTGEATVSIDIDVAPTAPADADGSANTVAEGAATGTTVGITAFASDADDPTVTYALSNDAGGRFRIDAESGVVSVSDASLIDYESATGHQYSIEVEATADGQASTKTFVIQVTNASPLPVEDGDDAADIVTEGAAEGTAVGVVATSQDPGSSPIAWSLVDNAGGRFQIDETTGVVTVSAFGAANIDYETATDHRYLITAQASDGLATSTADFEIEVANAGPSAPADSDDGANTVIEGAENGTFVGITASATDPNGGAVSFSLSEDADGRFQINASTGVVTVLDGTLIDFETGATHQVSVEVSDGTTTSAQDFTISVINAAPDAPWDTDTKVNNVLEGAAAGTPVGITALSADAGFTTVTYALTDDADGRFQIDETTGVVTVRDGSLLDASQSISHTIEVSASDGALNGTEQISITVLAAIETNGGTTLALDGVANVYRIVDDSGNVLTVMRNGLPYGPDSVNQWQAIEVEDDGAAGYFVLWQRTNGDLARWTVDDTGAYVSDVYYPISVQDDQMIIDFEMEFDTDLDGDTHIGTPPPPLPDPEIVLATVDGAYRIRDDVDPELDIPVTRDGQPIGPDSIPQWQAIHAEVDESGGYNVLWQRTNGDLARWLVDDQGAEVWNAYYPIHQHTDAFLEGLEAVVDLDLNDNDIIGTPPAIVEESGNTSLVVVDGEYLIVDVDTEIALMRNGQPYGPDTVAQWQAIHAESDGSGGYKVLWQRANGDLAVWTTGAVGNHISNDYHPIGSQTSDLIEDMEMIFDVDLNDDFEIGGVPEPVESEGDVALLVLSDRYRLDDGSDTVWLSRDAEPVGPDSFSQWSAIQAEEDGSGGFDVLWKRINGDYALWSVDSTGAHQSDSYMPVGSLTDNTVWDLETTFEADLDGDLFIGEPIP